MGPLLGGLPQGLREAVCDVALFVEQVELREHGLGALHHGRAGVAELLLAAGAERLLLGLAEELVGFGDALQTVSFAQKSLPGRMEFPDRLGKAAAWKSLFGAARHEVDAQYRDELGVQLALHKRARVFSSRQAALANDGHGIARFRKFEQLLESGFSWGRHHFERMFHNKCLVALAPTLFGEDEWATHGSDLIHERGWTLLSKMVIGTAPRRFGKSVSLAKVVAALAYALLAHRAGLNFTEYNITVFSTGKRASILLSNYVKKFLTELGLFDKDVYNCPKKTEERLELEKDGLTVIFMFVPANPDT